MSRFHLGLLVFGLTAVLAYGGNTYYVATTGSDSALGTNWDTAVATISQGVAKATGFYTDLVLVSNGTYNLSATVNVTNGITVRGFAGREQTFVNGGGAVRCFYLNQGGILDELTISNGYCGGSAITDGGGGAYIAKTGYIYNCTFTNNVANGNGGGVFIATVGLISNCQFIANSTTNQGSGYGGGGLSAPTASDSKIYDSYFYTNVTYFLGGGAYVQYLFNCTFVSNWGNYNGGGANVTKFASNCVFTYNCATGSASGLGGGCYVDTGAALVNSTNISFNISRQGGGVRLASGSTGAVLRVFSNTATSFGGGVFVEGGLLSNSVMYGNTAGLYGGGLRCLYSSCRVVDCIISNNSSCGIVYGLAAGNTGLVEGCTIINNTLHAGLFFTGAGPANILVRRCILAYNNSSDTGGGIFMNVNTGQVENCLIYSNSAATGGGAYMSGTNLLLNCTIVSNTATTSGAGIYATNTDNRVINTIVYGNNPMLYGTNAVAFTNCCLSETNGLLGSGLFTNAPRFKTP